MVSFTMEALGPTFMLLEGGAVESLMLLRRLHEEAISGKTT